MVALTGIEPAKGQFSWVQLGLSTCVFGPVQFATMAFRAVRTADVLPRCCPAARIRDPLARVIQPPADYPKISRASPTWVALIPRPASRVRRGSTSRRCQDLLQ